MKDVLIITNLVSLATLAITLIYWGSETRKSRRKTKEIRRLKIEALTLKALSVATYVAYNRLSKELTKLKNEKTL